MLPIERGRARRCSAYDDDSPSSLSPYEMKSYLNCKKIIVDEKEKRRRERGGGRKEGESYR